MLLDLCNKQLKSLVIPENTTELYCSNNELITLPKLPETLKVLYCDNNNLITLPELPKNLNFLVCDNNNLIKLPNFPINLRVIYCNNNKITSLPVFNKKLIIIYCHYNKLIEIKNESRIHKSKLILKEIQVYNEKMNIAKIKVNLFDIHEILLKKTIIEFLV